MSNEADRRSQKLHSHGTIVINPTGHVASAVNALYDRDIVTKSKDGQITKVDLNIEELGEIRAAAKCRATHRN